MPWIFFEEQIRHLVIMPGVTKVGGFSGCKNLETAFLPGTLISTDVNKIWYKEVPCKVYVLQGSQYATESMAKNMKTVILDVKKDAGWLQERYNIDLEADYRQLWEKDYLPTKTAKLH